MKPQESITDDIAFTAERGKIRVVPFTESFITDRYLGWLNDPEAVRFSRQRLYRHDRASALDYLRQMQDPRYRFLAVLDRETGRHVGNLTLTIDRDNSAAEIAILIGERGLWGRGYGSDAWAAAMAYLHDGLGVRLVTSGCMAPNKGMVRVMEKAGMEPYYVQKDFFLLDGRPVDSVHYASWRRP